MRLQHTSHHARQGGFTLVELMVTVAIALFLLYGLVTTVDNVRKTSLNQQKLAQLQDSQRFAMSAITSVIESAGYFPEPVTKYDLASAFPPIAAVPPAPAFNSAQAFAATHTNVATPDVLSVRFMTETGDNVINCQGGSNTTGADLAYVNTFTVNGLNQLVCVLNPGGEVALVNGVTNLQILFGVKRLAPPPLDYNVDTYVTPDLMTAADWGAISSVRVTLTFLNPLYVAGTTLPQFIKFDRVIEVMARAGNYT
jgi:type IV pilus assembly protein PilW